MRNVTRVVSFVVLVCAFNLAISVTLGASPPSGAPSSNLESELGLTDNPPASPHQVSERASPNVESPEGSPLRSAAAIPAASLTALGPAAATDANPFARVPAATPASSDSQQNTPGVVYRRGTSLLIDGRTFHFTGMNIYNANSENNCSYSLGSGSLLDEQLRQIGPGQEVFRAWFFQSLAMTGSRRDWRAFDHTLDTAAARAERVIVTLGNQWGDCEDGTYKSEEWYRSGYKFRSGNDLVPYREWVSEVVSRYRTNPGVFLWQLMNEAEDRASANDPCDVSAAETLKRWADDVAELVKKIDPTHLVSVGTMGSGQCGSAGESYTRLHTGPNIDVCEYHDYGDISSALPGDKWNGLAVRLRQCQLLGKPLIVGEMGMEGSVAGGSLSQRAAYFESKFKIQFASGVAGILLWAWHAPPSRGPNNASYDIGPGDPALGLLTRY